jgi:hypothetical protein
VKDQLLEADSRGQPYSRDEVIRQHWAGRSKDRSRDKDRARQISVERLETRHRILTRCAR